MTAGEREAAVKQLADEFMQACVGMSHGRREIMECKEIEDRLHAAIDQLADAQAVALAPEPIIGKAYEQGRWSRRNWEAMQEDGNRLAPSNAPTAAELDDGQWRAGMVSAEGFEPPRDAPYASNAIPGDQGDPTERADEAVRRPILTAQQLRSKAVRDGINALLENCTAQQRANLHRIHDTAPWKGLANCPEDELNNTYELVRRTVLKRAKL